jgi:hypothetical protein
MKDSTEEAIFPDEDAYDYNHMTAPPLKHPYTIAMEKRFSKCASKLPKKIKPRKHATPSTRRARPPKVTKESLAGSSQEESNTSHAQGTLM